MDKYDLTVIGSGPGGYVAAIRAAQLGMKVSVIERDNPGGVCLNWGCIPSKAILKCAEVYQNFLHSEDYGITTKGLSFDYSKVIQKSRNASSTLSKGVEFLLKKNKIDLFNGTGKLVDKKSKAMVALAVAIHGRCPHCTGSRIKKAMAAGFSKEEIAEAVMEVALVSSGTEMFWTKEVYDKFLLDEE